MTSTEVSITPGGAQRAELAAASRSLEGAPASEVVAWAWERWGEDLTLAASFQDCVLIDVATKVAPTLDVVFLDTGYHFEETLEYVEAVRRRFGLQLRVIEPRVGLDDRWKTDTEACCFARKVEPLERALAGRAAWMTGLRRADGPSRADAPVVSYDLSRGLVKVNPLAAWTDADVAEHQRRHDLPVHPLASQGFASIGCWPCTRAVAPGEDSRAGRWAGSDKTECGLHL